MNNPPLISVLMPVFNGEKYLSEAIQSVLTQTYSNFELLICNDASTDTSKQIIENLSDKRIVYFENFENKGIVYTRNRLFNEAKGDFFAIMDCDDVALQTKFEKQIRYMQKHLECGLCGTWAKIIDVENKVCGFIQMPVNHNQIQTNLLFQSSFVQSSVMIRKSALQALRYNSDFPVSEDFELWTQLAKQTKMHTISEYLLKYRWHTDNISQQKEALIVEKKCQIIKREFEFLFGRTLSESELSMMDNIGGAKKIDADRLVFSWEEAQNFIKALIRQNKKEKQIETSDFIAIIWYRWFFFCFVNRKYCNGIFPRFFSFNPIVLLKVKILTLRKLPSLLLSK